MHIEFCIEDQSGEIFLNQMIPKLIQRSDVTWRVHSYKGIGRIPAKQTSASAIKARMLLDNLPKIIGGMAKTPWVDVLIVILDSDEADCIKLKQDLVDIGRATAPDFNVFFRIAVEEMEAWYLGDLAAIRSSYPGAREAVLQSYVQDSICGTWERLADAVEAKGAAGLKAAGWPAPGIAKCQWAQSITPMMDPCVNQSPSFIIFRNKIMELTSEVK